MRATRIARLRARTGIEAGRLVATMRLPLPDAPGRYEVRARLTADGWYGEATCSVLRLPDQAPETGAGMVVLGQGLQRALPAIRTTLPPNWPGAILLDLQSRPAVRRISEAVRAARQGAHLCIAGLDPASLEQMVTATGLPLALHGARGNFMGMHHYRKAHRVFADVGGAGLADGAWAETLPAWALAELPGADVIAGCFTVPDGGREFLWRATVQTIPIDAGQITFWQLPLGRRRGGLLGERLLSALVGWLTVGSQ